MKLVVITSRFPYPLEKGDKLRLYHQIKELSKNHQITLIALSEHFVPFEHIKHLQYFCANIHILRLRKWHILFNLIRGFLIRMPLQVSYFYAPYLKKTIQNFIQSAQPDHVYCQLIRMAPYVSDLNNPKTLDFQDAFSAGMRRRTQQSPFWLKWFFQLETKRLQNYEQAVFEKFTHCTIISQQDQAALQIPNKEQITIVPNGVDINFFQPNISTARSYDLVFVGNMGYHPNVEAVKFLVHEILPIIKIHLPNVKLLIAGARPTAAVKNLASENVYISGWVGNILTAYQSAKLFIAPLFLGSGQQNKILEAMACGLPCITTPQVNNAIHASVNETIFIAEKAEEFATLAVNLLNDNVLRERIGEQARQFVEQRFGWQSATAILERLFNNSTDLQSV